MTTVAAGERPTQTTGDVREAVAVGTAVTLAALAVAYTFAHDPVRYTILITEDSWAEYGTAVALTLAALLLLRPLALPGSRRRRALLAAYIIGCLIVAGEEISWGQRLMDLATPEQYAKLNVQGELTLHNLAALDFVNSRLHTLLGYTVLFWCLASLSFRILRPARFEGLRAAGAPLISMNLLPVFLLPSYYLLLHPVAKSDEMGELFGSVAIMLWTLDLALRLGSPTLRSGATRLGVMVAGMIVLACAASVLSLSREPRLLTYRFNLMASRDYAERGMYDQSMALYEYIYRNPQYSTPDTRIEHARLLMRIGEIEAARNVIREAIGDLEGRGGTPLNRERLEAARELLGSTRWPGRPGTVVPATP